MMYLDYEHEGRPRKIGVHVVYQYDGAHPTDTTVALYPNADLNSTPVCGSALLHPSDTFCRPKGRKLAFERAVELFTQSTSHRAAIWKAFLQRVKVR